MCMLKHYWLIYLDKREVFFVSLTKDNEIQKKMTASKLRDHGNDFNIIYLVLSFAFQNIRHKVGTILIFQM